MIHLFIFGEEKRREEKRKTHIRIPKWIVAVTAMMDGHCS